MNGSKEMILRRIRQALKKTDPKSVSGLSRHPELDSGSPEFNKDDDSEFHSEERIHETHVHDEPDIKRNYQQQSRLTEEQKLNLFAERVNEYRAVTEIIDENEIGKRIQAVCSEAGVRSLVVPGGIDEKWISSLNSDVRLLRDEPEPLTKEELNSSDAVLTGAFLGVAQTGTIILSAGPGQGRRVLTLLPDYHICVVREDQIVGLIPEAISKLESTVKETGQPVTMISGPSATSDIELNRVEGVHGPRRLHVLVVRKYA